MIFMKEKKDLNFEKTYQPTDQGLEIYFTLRKGEIETRYRREERRPFSISTTDNYDARLKRSFHGLVSDV